MLAKHYKLDLRQDAQFFQRAQRVKTHHATIFYQPNDSGLQVQVIVGKRVAAKATERNTIKRTVYDTLAQLFPHYAHQQYSVVVVVHNQQIQATEALEKLTETITQLFITTA